jgi:hypothetical protein
MFGYSTGSHATQSEPIAKPVKELFQNAKDLRAYTNPALVQVAL